MTDFSPTSDMLCLLRASNDFRQLSRFFEAFNPNWQNVVASLSPVIEKQITPWGHVILMKEAHPPNIPERILHLYHRKDCKDIQNKLDGFLLASSLCFPEVKDVLVEIKKKNRNPSSQFLWAEEMCENSTHDVSSPSFIQAQAWAAFKDLFAPALIKYINLSFQTDSFPSWITPQSFPKLTSADENIWENGVYWSPHIMMKFHEKAPEILAALDLSSQCSTYASIDNHAKNISAAHQEISLYSAHEQKRFFTTISMMNALGLETPEYIKKAFKERSIECVCPTHLEWCFNPGTPELCFGAILGDQTSGETNGLEINIQSLQKSLPELMKLGGDEWKGLIRTVCLHFGWSEPSGLNKYPYNIPHVRYDDRKNFTKLSRVLEKIRLENELNIKGDRPHTRPLKM